jgi:hypothetical protein
MEVDRVIKEEHQINIGDRKVEKINAHDNTPFFHKKFTVVLNDDFLEIVNQNGNEVLKISKEKARECIKIHENFTMNTIFRDGSKKLKLHVEDKELPNLRTWINVKFGLTDKDYDKYKEYDRFQMQIRIEIRGLAAALIMSGVWHHKLEMFLDPIWGTILILFGCIILIFPKHFMFIANGVLIVTAGLLNIGFGSKTSSVGWISYGSIQVLIGLYQIFKYFYCKAVLSKLVEKLRTNP